MGKPKGTQRDAADECAKMIHLLDRECAVGMVQEFEFASPRRWRLDIAWPALKVAVEIDGMWSRGRNGKWVPGRHCRPEGYAKDCEKFNFAEILGWHVLHYPPEMVRKNPWKIIKEIKDMKNV